MGISAAQEPSIDQLYQIARKDVLVATFLDHWRYGDFASFEQCLVRLVIAQAERNAYLLSQLTNFIERTPRTIIHAPTKETHES